MTTTTVAITGVNGYVGGYLANYLRERGYTVIGLSRQRAPAPDTCRMFSLSDELADSLLDGVDCLVHCAWDMRANDAKEYQEVNVGGSLQLCELARKVGVRMVFVSSIAAFEGCKSMYGKAKLVVEEKVREIGGVIVRPGLVYGENAGGMAGALQKVGRWPVVPIIRARMNPVHQDDLCGLLLEVIGAREIEPMLLIAAQRNVITLKGFLEWILPEKARVYVPVPWRVVWFGLKTLEMIGLKGRFRSDSVVSLANENRDLDFANHSGFRTRFRELSV